MGLVVPGACDHALKPPEMMWRVCGNADVSAGETLPFHHYRATSLLRESNDDQSHALRGARVSRLELSQVPTLPLRMRFYEGLGCPIRTRLTKSLILGLVRPIDCRKDGLELYTFMQVREQRKRERS